MQPHLLTLGKRAWELYLEKEVLDPRLVRTSVANSWRRCRLLHIDPLQNIGAQDDRGGRLLEERLCEKEQLIRIARPFMHDLYHFFSGSEFQVVLTDEHGLLLEVVGDQGIITRTREVHLFPGASWSEEKKGTNAIGTALVEKAPVQIYAWEHFCEENQFLTCSAAPIMDAEGKIIGCMDLSADFHKANPHTMGMVVAAVRAIENQLLLEQARHKLYLASHYSSALLRGIAEGLVVVDRNGIVTDINVLGGRIFGVNPVTAKGLPLSMVCPGSPPLLHVLKSGKDYDNQEIVLNRMGKRVRSSASPLRDESGSIIGAVALFHEIKDLNVKSVPVIYCHRHSFDDIVGDSPAMKAAKDWAILASACTSTVLILGESGTGKELFANAIHNTSSRAHEPFIALNCAAIPEGLIESELFGYVDGSFTGARKGGLPGKFELANGGSIFLDEIGEMSLNVQAKLLRVLQERKVSRIGSAQETEVDIRIIAATQRDLSKDVEVGRFREDLYYRIAVLEVKVPPIRERREDIPPLVRCLVTKISMRLERPPVEIDSECLRRMSAYGWPGNVRAMENVLERALVRMGSARVLRMEHLDLPPESSLPITNPNLNLHVKNEKAAPEIKSLRDVEKEAIAEALSMFSGNIKKTAARLGIARNTLYRKMEDYDLLPASERHS
jgi:transcriptional regulator of acetoin/glycerol metabolism